jgi:hypothetical protein
VGRRTLSASTRKIPNSSSMAHCVTIFKWRTRRMAVHRCQSFAWPSEENCTLWIMTVPYPYSFGTANCYQWTSVGGICGMLLTTARMTQQLLTEWHRACHLAGVCHVLIPCRRGRISHHRGDLECVRAQSLNLEDLVRLLDYFAQTESLIQLLLPLVTSLRGFCVKDVRATHSSIVVEC